jgi:ABC-type glycerol-3-phosphate transport system substrate-binding protein
MRMKRLALAASALLLTACGGAAPTTAPVTVTVTETPGSKTIIDPYGSYDTVIDKNGTYIVGADIFPGRYRTAGKPGCYWARLGSGDAHDIIDSHKNGGPQVVEIKESDTAFVTQDCGMWQMIPWI